MTKTKKPPSQKREGWKGEITLKILEIIGKMVLLPIEIIWAMGAAGYGASMKDLDREIARFREGERVEFEVDPWTKQKCYKLLCKLKKEGFIAEKTERGKSFLFRTRTGTEKVFKLKVLGERHQFISREYESEKTDKVTIVIFDVPEEERWKRGWLRDVLRGLGLKNIQKSVFIGKVRIPEQFFEDLRKLNMFGYVEIFEVGKAGTLSHVL